MIIETDKQSGEPGVTKSLLRIEPKSWPIAATAVTHMLAIGTRLAVSLVTLPALLAYLGADGLGLWFVALGILGLFGFVNTGMSSAVLTAISRAKRENGLHEVQRLVSVAMAVACVFAFLTLLVGMPLAFGLDWNAIFKVNNAVGSKDLAYLLATLVFYLAIGFPSGLPNMVLIALMEGHIAHLVEILAIIAAACCLMTAIAFEAPVFVLAISFTLPQAAIVLFLSGLQLYRRGIRLYAPDVFEPTQVRGFLIEGARLVASQASFSLASQTDLILIGVIMGASAGAGYGVAQRIFALPLLVTNAINQALWPALSKADVENRGGWIRESFMRLLAVSLAFAGMTSIGFACFYPEIIWFWLQDDLPVDWAVVIGMAISTTLTVFAAASGILLRSVMRTKLLARLMMLMAAVNIPASITLIHMVGAAGAVWGTVIAYSVCLILPYLFIVPRVLVVTEKLPKPQK